MFNYSMLCDYRLSSDDQLAHFFYTPFQVFCHIVLTPLVAAFGLFGNVVFLVAVLCYQRMRTITNFYLVNLAVADLIFIISNATHQLQVYISSPSLAVYFAYRSKGAYIALLVTNYATYYASIFLIVLVSFERYKCVCHPMRSRVVRSMKRTCILVSVTWIFALLFAFSIGYALMRSVNFHIVCVVWPLRDKYQFLRPVFNKANIDSEHAITALVYVAKIPLLVALILISYFYARIVQELRQRTRTATTDAQHQLYIRTQRKVLRMLAVNSIVFFLCLALGATLNFCLLIPDVIVTIWYQDLMTFSGVAKLLNSAANPYIYGATNEEYRMVFYQMFTKCCKSPNVPEALSGRHERNHADIPMKGLP